MKKRYQVKFETSPLDDVAEVPFAFALLGVEVAAEDAMAAIDKAKAYLAQNLDEMMRTIRPTDVKERDEEEDVARQLLNRILGHHVGHGSEPAGEERKN